MKLFAVLLLCASPFVWAATGKGALDKTTLENYLKHVELFRGDVTFKIDDPQPAKYLPGFSEVLVHLIFNNVEKDELFYISADGQNIIRGDVFNLAKSPFQSNLDKLTLADQPSFGPAEAPVTIVEFGDFECPDCKMEAPILRQRSHRSIGRKGAACSSRNTIARNRASLVSCSGHRRALRVSARSAVILEIL